MASSESSPSPRTTPSKNLGKPLRTPLSEKARTKSRTPGPTRSRPTCDTPQTPNTINVNDLRTLPNANTAEYWLRKARFAEAHDMQAKAEKILLEALRRGVDQEKDIQNELETVKIKPRNLSEGFASVTEQTETNKEEDAGSCVMLTPTRVNKKAEREAMGGEYATTPVRRSARVSYRSSEELDVADEVLSRGGYSLKPNPSLTGSNLNGAKSPAKGCLHVADEAAQRFQEPRCPSPA